jgi:hypothetical protein
LCAAFLERLGSSPVASEAFVQTVRSERGPAAGDIIQQYLARRLEQDKPLAPLHVNTGLRLTGVLVEGAPSYLQALKSLGVGDDFTKIGFGGQGIAYAVKVNQGKESLQGVLKRFESRPHTLRFDPLVWASSQKWQRPLPPISGRIFRA